LIDQIASRTAIRAANVIACPPTANPFLGTDLQCPRRDGQVELVSTSKWFWKSYPLASPRCHVPHRRVNPLVEGRLQQRRGVPARMASCDLFQADGSMITV
jgi:hypothetical protein